MGRNDPQAAISFYNNKVLKSRPARTANPSLPSSTASSSTKPPVIVLPPSAGNDPQSNLPKSSNSSNAQAPTLVLRPDPELDSMSDGPDPPHDIGGSIGKFSTSGPKGLGVGGLYDQIPTTPLVSRPASPTPSLPPTSSENSDPERDPELRPPQLDGLTVTETDPELDARRAEEAKREAQERKKEEARKLEKAKENHVCWSFRLPPQRFPQVGDPDAEWDFDIRLLTAMAQNGEKEKVIRDYLQRCSRTHGSVNVNQDIEVFLDNQPVGVFPAMFYAVETNNEKLVQLFTQYGGNVNCFATYKNCHRIPLLGFAIINALRLEQPTTAMIATLLSLGATAEVIPTIPSPKTFLSMVHQKTNLRIFMTRKGHGVSQRRLERHLQELLISLRDTICTSQQ